MSIHRTHHNKDNPYVILNKDFLDNPSLSAKAKGLLAYLLSRPDGWETRTEQLMSVMKDGRDSILSGLKELEDEGYFVRYAVRESGTNKITHWVKDVYETPQKPPDNDTTNGKPVYGEATNGKAVNGKAVNGKAVRGKPGYILNNEITITELVNTDPVINEKEPLKNQKPIDILETKPVKDCNEVLEAEVVIDDSQPTDVVSITPFVQKDSSQALSIAANDNSNQVLPSKSVLKMRENWESKGVLPRNMIEINAWAMEEIGDYIRTYRKSGNLMSSNSNDLSPDFVRYVAKQWKGKDLDAAISRIQSLEYNPKGNWTPRDWTTLKTLVTQWLASKATGNENINLAQEHKRFKEPTNEYARLRYEESKKYPW